MAFLEQFKTFASIIVLLMTVMYLYQLIYMAISLLHKKVKPLPETSDLRRYAIMISARNEAGVIHELLQDLKKQKYPSHLYDIYVIADNCTDDTAQVARENGAIVYERFNQSLVGKGYALNELYHWIRQKQQKDYDAYIVFDADNLVDAQFITEVNKKFVTGKYEALTTYRNTKNFATNWLTAAYSIWFMHEARHLNYVRDLIGAQCMISGTGFVVSGRLMRENNGWPYYFMTEDIQFSVDSTIRNMRIGYVDSAILYDEQPSTMNQSWKQRLRWAKGFYQIDGKYLGTLVKGVLKEHGAKRLSYYDVLMTVLPCSLLTVLLVGFALWIFMAATAMPYYVRLVFQQEMASFLWMMGLNLWVGMMAMGAFTVLMEWKRIPATTFEKLKFIPLFPMYMITYIPISVHALFAKVQWTPIQHYSTAQIAMSQKQKSL